MGEGTATTQTTPHRRVIERPRLTRLLDESDGRIKMLVAPAGYGKTTLAREWVRAREAVWYSCSAASRDVAALAAGLGRATAKIVPGASEALLERLSVTARPDEEAEVLADMVAGDLAEWPVNSWLVLDDYEAIAGAARAEDFVEKLVLDTPLNLLIVTRRRPAWVSSRRILYGEVFEIDQTDLAMTTDEAGALLAGTGGDPTDLIALARGWPAILTLASASGATAPELTSAPHLYRFFADEIYSRLGRSVRRTLCELALWEVRGRGLAPHATQTERAQQAIRPGLERGFLIGTEDGRIEMHPLMRSFLERKLREEAPKVRSTIASRVARDLIAHELWDEAFTVISGFRVDALFDDLIEASVEPLLEAGRTSTLKAWLEGAPDETPVVSYARAELAFRDGRFHESEVLAVAAARDAPPDSDLGPRAHFVAGRAAHVSSRLEEAIAHYRCARVGSQSGEGQRRASLGELAVRSELHMSDQAEELLASLGPVDSLPPADQVVYVGRQLNFEIHGGLRPNLDAGRRAWELLGHVKDPVARSSFRNVLGWALAMSGHYSEALAVTAEQLKDATRCRLNFVVPHALITQAVAHCVNREYLEAERLLRESERLAAETRDETASYIAWAAMARLRNSQGAFELTLARQLPTRPVGPPWLIGEILSCYSIAHAALGHSEKALQMAFETEVLTQSAEVRTNIACARAIVALRKGDADEGLRQARLALRTATDSGAESCLVSAYRGFPELVLTLLADAEASPDLIRIMTLVSDTDPRGGAAPIESGSILSLSPREREVFALLAQGLSNRAIGIELFISPVTVKVHVRHIFEKLGVKTRTEAALRGSQLSR